ncbi:hypothetical protein Cfla_0229 [Cellulomonas flavigena DSM 20109]|uniref:LPXTG-motif cell wall anchor domain protein n=1 Tax=Cellulomonas flavigena (strain ATCC 482 / DSM 20109 / BCRC 11376 / JCM 18109 / NBRC 3775 / NCIMB 8073 / NRS 134) TaxID=446466 RepID=D5UGG5_CELFN|nr:hypothetical protein [Cellulomonas flavigena]ADG73148.1 hypothetical protein Cfla_0229 [Cellulomonas flavigena DSM 20109]
MTTLPRTVATAAAVLTAALTSLALVAPAAAAGPGASAALTTGLTCDDVTCRFVFAPDVFTPQTFVVPPGVTRVTADLVGGAGGRVAEHPGGAGGALRTSVPVRPGETLTAQVPRSGDRLQVPADARPDAEPADHVGGELAALYRGTGTQTTAIAVAGGGGAGGSTGAGGAGGGWHADPTQVLRGQDGGGNGAGLGATPTAGGGVFDGEAALPGVVGSGPAGHVPGGRGVGGSTGAQRVSWWIVTETWQGAPGGMGWYGGGSGAFVTDSWVAGGGGGSGYLAPGRVAQQVPAATVEAAGDQGLVAIEWAVDQTTATLEPVVLDAGGADSGGVVDGELESRDLVLSLEGLPVGARVSVDSGPVASETLWGTVADDGTVRVPYTVPAGEHLEDLWLDVAVLVDDEVTASSRIDLDVPALEVATVLDAPREVAPGGGLTVEIGRTGTQFGAPTPGLAPVVLRDLLLSGAVAVVLDGEVVDPQDLQLPQVADLPATGTVRVGLTAPEVLGDHTLAVVPGPSVQDTLLEETALTFAVVTAPAAEPTVAPTAPAGAAAGVAPTAAPTAAAASERSEVLAAASGVLATTGAKVTGLAIVATLLIVAGGVVLHARGRGRAAHAR